MPKPKRIQLRRTKGWRKPKGAVVVSRPSKWGNPYRIDGYRIVDSDGNPVPEAERKREATLMAVRDFEMWLHTRPKGMAMASAARAELRGKDLACWCPLPKPGEMDMCHADVLIRISNEEPAHG